MNQEKINLNLLSKNSIYGKTIYNMNNKISDSVTIYLKGSCDTTNIIRTGYYVAEIIINNNHPIFIYGNETKTSVNQMLLSGLISCINKLNNPSLINLYTHTRLGFSSIKVNTELKDQLFKLIKDNNHCIIENISNEKQASLKYLYQKNKRYIS